MKRIVSHVILALCLLAMGACSKGGIEPEESTISITLANDEGIYVVKAGRSIAIEPVVSNAVAPFYAWKLDGSVIGREATYEFTSKTPGRYHITFQVNAANGTVEKELRVDVFPLAPPVVGLPVTGEYIEAISGRETVITPTVENSEAGEATYLWLLEGKEVSTEPTYTFCKDELGDYSLVLIVTNEDGEGRNDAIVRVKEVPEVSVFFESETIYAPAGRAIAVAPYLAYSSASTTFEWKVDGVVQTEATGQTFRFTPSGVCTVTVSVTDAGKTASKSISVTPAAAEGTYLRAATGASSASCNKVYEFLAAPGQFVNEGYTAKTMAQANAYAEDRLRAGSYVSLGAFGGYIVVGFDHSVANTPGADLAIKGNAFAGSSEPGIVWVMQDENGNGLPDDTWYELAGSETGKPETRQRYSVTYFRPTNARQNVRWTDNFGNSGTVDINNYHNQESYYPAWVPTASYTLRGTNLFSRTYDKSGTGTYWVNPEFDWGYVDNLGQDYVGNETHLELDNAVYPDGTPAALQYIDFVKVQVGLQVMAGWLGENSTEVFGFRDMNL